MHPGLYDFAVMERSRQVRSSLTWWRRRASDSSHSSQLAYENHAVRDIGTQVRGARARGVAARAVAAQPSPRESCFNAVSTDSAAATTSDSSGCGIWVWSCTT